jgi:hypothetical protein
VLRLILLIDSNKRKRKNGQISEYLDLSAQVNLEGLEYAILILNQVKRKIFSFSQYVI